MRTDFHLSPNDVEISMNFTFSFMDDPDNEQLYGNITWRIPDLRRPSHWVHSEDTCKLRNEKCGELESHYYTSFTVHMSPGKF